MEDLEGVKKRVSALEGQIGFLFEEIEDVRNRLNSYDYQNLQQEDLIEDNDDI